MSKCNMCGGKRWVAVPNGPDDFDKEPCACSRREMQWDFRFYDPAKVEDVVELFGRMYPATFGNQKHV